MRNIDVMVIPMDDFDIILGNDFFERANVAIHPNLSRLMIANRKKPCFVQGFKELNQLERIPVENFSAMQLARVGRRVIQPI